MQPSRSGQRKSKMGSENHPDRATITLYRVGPMNEPDVLEDLEEMWPEMANTEGRRWKHDVIAAVMLLAAQEIRELRAKVEALNV
jgi:hypothetical protein